MPLLQNKEAWEEWVKAHTGKLRKGDKKPVPYVVGCGLLNEENPLTYPCWLVAHYYSADCGYDHWVCSFIYKNKEGQWDLEEYESKEGWN